MSDPEPNYTVARHAMVISQLRPAGVAAPGLLVAMGAIARELFVEPASRAASYIDRAIPAGDGNWLNPPVTTGLLIDAADVRPGNRVLLVGTATAYTAAVITAMGASVTTMTAATLAKGIVDANRYDVVMIDGAVDHVPAVLIDALASDGRLVTATVAAGVTRLAIGRKGGRGFGLVAFADAEAVVLPGFSTPKEFVF